MRVYQLRHYEVMMPEGNGQEVQNLLYYEQLCYDKLTIPAISYSHAIEIAIIHKGRIEQRPGRIHTIIDVDEIAPFYFVIGKN
jgi:hypothetical protein